MSINRSKIRWCLFLSAFAVHICAATFSGKNPQELNISVLGHAARIEHRILFSYLDQSDPVLMMYDFHNGQTQRVVGGGMIFFLPFILADGDRFLAIPATKSKDIYPIDNHGNPSPKQVFERFEGWAPGNRMVQPAPYEEHLFLVTIENKPENTLSLALVDFRNESVQTWFSMELDTKRKRYWLPLGEKIYFITQATGKIEEVDPDRNFMVKRVVRKEHPLILKEKARPGRKKHLSILSQPNFQQGKIFFRLFREEGEGADRRIWSENLVFTERLKYRRPLYSLGSYEGFDLAYDWAQRELSIVAGDN
ncbi:MAG: hypothetical protein QNK37_16205 [Acidobacteriota bacterium]|nr:hypothetical protein [Acidobacteriota bacterium]